MQLDLQHEDVAAPPLRCQQAEGEDAILREAFAADCAVNDSLRRITGNGRFVAIEPSANLERPTDLWRQPLLAWPGQPVDLKRRHVASGAILDKAISYGPNPNVSALRGGIFLGVIRPVISPALRKASTASGPSPFG